MVAKWNRVRDCLPEFHKRVIVAIQGLGDYPQLESGFFYKIGVDSEYTFLIGLTVFHPDRARQPYSSRSWDEIGLRYWMEIPELPKDEK